MYAGLLAAGAGIKTVEILLWELNGSAFLMRLIILYDPGAKLFADAVTQVLFENRGIAPPRGEAELYAVGLVLGFALECLLLGAAIRFALRGTDRNYRP